MNYIVRKIMCILITVSYNNKLFYNILSESKEK